MTRALRARTRALRARRGTRRPANHGFLGPSRGPSNQGFLGPTQGQGPRNDKEAGYTLVALMATVTIMLIAMAAAVPSWEYVMKDDREQELIFRGGEIADAIQRFQQRNGNALPPNLEVLVKGKFLRREYDDPMTKDGKWRFIRQGESIGPIRPPGTPGAPGSPPGSPTSPTSGRQTLQSPTSSSSTSQRTSSFSSPTGTVGGIQGVASTSQEEGLRIFNGRTKYSEWIFMPGQPRQVGRAARTPGTVGGVPGAPNRPAGAPTVPGGAPTIPGGLPAPPPRR